jgi:ribosomal protein L11
MYRKKENLMISILAHPSRLAAVAALPLLLAAKPLSAPVSDGTTYEWVVRSQSSRTGDKESVMMRGRGTFAGKDGKLEILEASAQSTGGQSNMFGGKGSYFLVLDGGKKMMMVDPTNRQYMEWDMASMMAGMSKMVNAVGGMVKMQMSDVKIDANNMGPGETIQGYRTVHYQMVQNYTMSVKVFGHESKSRNESTTDYYFAPALKGLANPFVSNSQAYAQSFDMFNNPDYKTQMSAAMSKIGSAGVPLKSVMKSVRTDEKGKQETSIVTTEMVNFKNGDIPSSTFAIPAGYTLVQMPKLEAGSDNSGGQKAADINADSIAKAAKDSAKAGMKDAAKDAAKEGAAKKLRGNFKH